MARNGNSSGDKAKGIERGVDTSANVALLREIKALKQLLILLLVKLGSTSEEIGAALGVHHTRVRQIVPTGRIKKIAILTSRG